MGLEAECTVRVGRKTSAGKALLETEALIFRGDFSLQVPLDSIRSVAAEGGTLVVTTAEQEVRFELGAPHAERWAKRIQEPKGIFDKLEIKPELRVAVVDLRDASFVASLRERTAGVAEGRVPQGVDVVFFGAETRAALRTIQLLRTRMIDTAVLWVVRPKGGKDIAESDVFEAIRGAGLTDVKVVAFSKTHTAHKCVIPLDQRGVARRRAPLATIPPSAPAMEPKKGAPAKAGASDAPRRPPGKSSRPPPKKRG